MCGRFTLTVTGDELLEAFGLLDVPEDFEPRFNIAPTQQVLIVTGDDGEAKWARWGLIPRWAKDARIGARLINARAETVGEKPSFRDAYRHRRCLVLADGFYEWRHEDGVKKPMYIRPRSRRPVAFAGLWETWRSPEAFDVRSCTIVTTGANAVVEPIHDRMPVILTPDAYERWCTGDAPRNLQEIRELESSERLVVQPASTAVNSPAHDGPECLIADEPLPEGQLGFDFGGESGAA